MLTIISFLSFFSFFVNAKAMQIQNPRLFSVISCNSFFSLFVSIQDHASVLVRSHAFSSPCEACFCSASPGVKSESQHTRCTHRVLPGLAGACRPSTPENAERQKP
jgi:hypothetical protein